MTVTGLVPGVLGIGVGERGVLGTGTGVLLGIGVGEVPGLFGLVLGDVMFGLVWAAAAPAEIANASPVTATITLFMSATPYLSASSSNNDGPLVARRIKQQFGRWVFAGLPSRWRYDSIVAGGRRYCPKGKATFRSAANMDLSHHGNSGRTQQFLPGT